MLFVDQPVGTGLSFTDPEVELPTSSAETAEDLADFLEIFLAEVAPGRRGPFHIAGESYAVCIGEEGCVHRVCTQSKLT